MNDTAAVVDRDQAVEESLWEALEMDTLGKEMKSGSFAPNNNVMMGTTRTQNACEQCSNSNTTSGCGGC